MKPDPTLKCSRRRLSFAAVWLAAACALVPGCGGSGGVDSGGTGIQVQTLAVGPISGFGSIVVNGVHFDETQAQLLDSDGLLAPASALALGVMTSIDASTVVVSATRADARAQVVRIREELIGPVDSVQSTGTSFAVLGQTVVVNAGTAFDDRLAAGMASISPGSVLAVYGQQDSADGRIVATRVELRPAAASYLVRGVVTLLDRGAGRLNLGTLTVSLAALTALPSDLAVGSLVRVKLRTATASGVREASELRLDGLIVPDRSNVELEGRVTAFTSVQRFSVDGVAVDATAATVTGTVALGVRVEVEGPTRAGVLTARKVQVDADEGGGSEAFQVEGRITAVDSVAQTFVVRGVTVAWSTSTRFESSTPADLAVNRSVSAKGRLGADRSRIDATLVHVEN